jgi:hypothetical protein
MLAKAMKQWNVDEIKWLLENGANPNVFGIYNPLLEAMVDYNTNPVRALEIISLLLKYPIISMQCMLTHQIWCES